MIQVEIENRLSDELLFGALAKGGHVDVDVAENALTFAFGA
ncbi:MAG: hypothetical protein AAB658_14735 [Chloroflexota bacterium]